jgi:hypothetical protein
MGRYLDCENVVNKASRGVTCFRRGRTTQMRTHKLNEAAGKCWLHASRGCIFQFQAPTMSCFSRGTYSTEFGWLRSASLPGKFEVVQRNGGACDRNENCAARKSIAASGDHKVRVRAREGR